MDITILLTPIWSRTNSIGATTITRNAAAARIIIHIKVMNSISPELFIWE
jgi:hypothetical protein